MYKNNPSTVKLVQVWLLSMVCYSCNNSWPERDHLLTQLLSARYIELDYGNLTQKLNNNTRCYIAGVWPYFWTFVQVRYVHREIISKFAVDYASLRQLMNPNLHAWQGLCTCTYPPVYNLCSGLKLIATTKNNFNTTKCFFSNDLK